MDRNEGYEIQKATLFDNGRGFALGYHPKAPAPYVTWRFSEEAGKRDYYWGHYHSDAGDALMDYTERIIDYERQYGVKRVQVEAPRRYKYYSTQRPIDIGTFPKLHGNEPDEIENYDQRVPVENGTFLAWGHIAYSKPLAEKEMYDYELRPSRDNPDVRRVMGEQAQIAGEWEDKNNVPETSRMTWFHPDFGSYAAKEFVTPEALAAYVRGVEIAEAIDGHFSQTEKPAPIAEQMRAAQEMADKQPVTPVEKDAPNRGGEER